jgi:hypothetical protein
MAAQPGSVILPSRLPPRITLLRDMKYWSRAEANAWIQHILQGQRGTLPVKHRFNWQSLPGTAKQGDRPLACVTFIAEATSHLRWAPEELLYAEKVREPSNPDHNLYKGLPYAWTSHIYCHDPRDRDNNFSLSQIYSIFFNYMCWTFSLSHLYYRIILCFSVAMIM